MYPIRLKAWFGTLDDTPVGQVGVAASEQGLVRISLFGMEGLKRAPEFRSPELAAHSAQDGDAPAFLLEALRQVDEYLCGKRRVFELPLDLVGYTPFSMQIMAACKAIPFGGVRTYAQLAVEVGRPRTARFVGNIMARNPLPLVIPCHRVVGTDGGLHGYGAPGGLATKAWLLKMESNE